MINFVYKINIFILSLQLNKIISKLFYAVIQTFLENVIISDILDIFVIFIMFFEMLL